jgi:hypothetical protein
VIDAAAVDGRRRLVLVRRDNVEHLLMIGGPSDIVVEQNIVRAVPVNAPRDVPVPRASGTPEISPRPAAETVRPQAFEDETSWPPPAEPPARSAVTRPDLTLRPRAFEPRPAEPRAFAEPAIRAAPAAITPRSLDPAPPPIVPVDEPAAEPAPDAALASMAQRLEAALRRPGVPEPRQPPPTIQATEQRIEAAFELPSTEQTPTAPDAAPPQPSEPKGAKPKSVLDSLEEEMASLLGRPPDKP